MILDKKIEIIQKLKEDELREKVLIPLFSKMGFIDPIIHHHSNEKGKDIILKEYDSKFKETKYLAVIVKAGDVNGSASGNSNYFTLINQVKQALNEPYKHIYDLKEVLMDEVIIVISGRFLPTSLESIYGTLKQERLDKSIRKPIDINKLPSLIDEFFPEYWDEFENEIETLIVQRNHLLNNFSKISKVLFPEFKNQEEFLSIISKSDYDVELLPFKSISKYVANINRRTIEIDEINDYYTDTYISNYYADIKEYVFEIKNNAKKILYDIDDVVRVLKAILDESDPEKLVDLTYDLGSYVGYYGMNFSTNDVENQKEFGYALKEYRTKKTLLIENNVYDFYQKTIERITITTIEALTDFYTKYTKENKDAWLGLNVKLDINGKKNIELKFYTFIQKPRLIERDEFMRMDTREIEKSNLINDSEIQIEFALNNYGFGFKDDEPNPEKKAIKANWIFKQKFEKLFFEIIGYKEV